MNLWDRIWGPSLEKKTSEEPQQQISKNSLVLPDENTYDGSIIVDSSSFSQYGTNFDYQIPEDESVLITKYRDLAEQPEIDKAVNAIINECFSYDDDAMPVSIRLDDVKLSEPIKKKIREEFETILYMLNFKYDSYDVFKRWYVDGRLYYQKVYDENNIKKGIVQLKYIDPRKIRKVKRKLDTKNSNLDKNLTNQEYEEFYIYNPDGINNKDPRGYRISKDSITYIHSGLFTKENKTILSHLHKAIRFYNVLRSIEDSVVIYRLVRSAEKRVFNIEVGDLPTQAAEQQMKKVIDKFRKKLSFNPQTGEVIEQKRFMTMIEDFWFAKRDGKGTTVDVLTSGQNLGEMDDVDYFKKKLYESLNVPISRLDSTTGFSLGRASEISREELAFSKFISRLRKRFSGLFDDLLRSQLIAKKILTDKEWRDINRDVVYDFLEDNFFTEMKWSEIYQNRFNMMRDANDLVGEHFSKVWAQKNILKMSDEEIIEEKKKIEKEREESPDIEDDDTGGDEEGKQETKSDKKDSEDGSQFESL